MPCLICCQLVRDRRTRTHQRHVAHQHIEKLREFIQTRSAQESPHSCDPFVVGDLVNYVPFPFAGTGSVWLEISFVTNSL